MTGHHPWSEIKHKRTERLHDELVFYIREASGKDESYWFIETYRKWRWKVTHV